MTDAEIRKNAQAVQEVIDGCDDSSISEKVRYTWASCAAKWCREIADEMERRLKGPNNADTNQ